MIVAISIVLFAALSAYALGTSKRRDTRTLMRQAEKDFNSKRGR